MDPMELLPPECWELVFDKVEDPQDWLNLCRASPCFHELVAAKRTTALFPQVIPHVLEYLGAQLGEIVRPRTVCRAWKAALDKLVENSDFPGGVKRRMEKSYSFRSSARISSFLDRFEGHHHDDANPFVGRFASFQFDSIRRRPQVIAEYNSWATRLLSTFGTQITTLQIILIDNKFDNWATRILDCLQQTSNLESLRVHCHCNCTPNPSGGGMGGLRALSPLLNLKSISFNMPADDLNRPAMLDLQNALLPLCCNPNTLTRVDTFGFPSVLQTFPSLKSAHVSLLVDEDCTNLPSPPWPSLSELTLSTYLHGSLRSSGMRQCVEDFKSTLTSLHLQRPLERDGRNPWKLKLDLAQLMRRSTNTTTTTTSEQEDLPLGFLTRLTNLEILSVAEDDFFFKRTGAVVQFLVDRLRLWEVLPKLSQIRLIEIERADFRKVFVANRSNREFRRKTNK